MLPENIDIRYTNALYEFNFADVNCIPKNLHGIYILYEKGKIYCGGTDDLRRRIPESRREQGFGEKIYVFPVEPSQLSNSSYISGCVRWIETYCIGAFYTLIQGHGIPFTLTNKDDACLLPQAAWTELDLSLPTHIAQTVLYSLGLPHCLIELPWYEAALFGADSIGAAHNASIWPQIIDFEREKRKNEGLKSPMLVVKFSRE
jgi:hypothetical protein